MSQTRSSQNISTDFILSFLLMVSFDYYFSNLKEIGCFSMIKSSVITFPVSEHGYVTSPLIFPGLNPQETENH